MPEAQAPPAPSPVEPGAAEPAPVAAVPVVETAPIIEPPAAPAPAPAPPPTPGGGTYTIAAGDTISRIAAAYGITSQALLDANGLNWSSIIYPGGTLVIPGGSAPAPAASAVR